MTKSQIDKLLAEAYFLNGDGRPELIETHISWVILCKQFAYKIKKPILYPFLDYSTLEKRKYYCTREIELNKRLTHDVYLDIQPVVDLSGHYSIGRDTGIVIDYAVKMRMLDPQRQMNVMLVKNQVTAGHIQKLAEKIALFHKTTDIIHYKDISEIQKEFNELASEKENLDRYLGAGCSESINKSIRVSDSFLQTHMALLDHRLTAGFFRDCHGDLHSRNVFLLPEPVPFDCIEFNDQFRYIDVLNEIAFLCMDLEAYGQSNLSELFLQIYNGRFPVINNAGDRRLFIYYKLYRANIRTKVSSLRIRSATSDEEKKLPLVESRKYLRLMDSYCKML